MARTKAPVTTTLTPYVLRHPVRAAFCDGGAVATVPRVRRQEGSTCQSAPERGQSVATRLGQQDVEDEDCLYGTSASSVDGQQEHEHACTEDLYPDQEYEEISRVRAGPWAPRGVAPPGGCRSGHAVLMEADDTVYARYVHAVKQLFDTSHGPPPLHFSSACALQAAAFPMPAWSDEHKTITWGEARRGL